MATLKYPVNQDDHIAGNPQAPAVLVEYGDYQCPACGEAYPVVKQLQQQFGSDLCLVFRNFPLVDIHPQAYDAAVMAEFAGANGHFWQAHDALYENQQALGPQFYAQLTEALGLSMQGMQLAFESRQFDARIQRDINGGIRSGVNGTPTFFLNGTRVDLQTGFDELFDKIGAVIGG